MGMTQAHYIYCVLYFCYYISSTSDPQALYPGMLGTPEEHLPTSHWVILVFCGHGGLAGPGPGPSWGTALTGHSFQHTAFLKGTAQPLGVFDLRPLKWELLLSLSPLSSCRGLHGDPPQTTVSSHPHTWTSLASCPKPQN